MKALGDYIGGAFVAPEGDTLLSYNPAKDGARVFETGWLPARARMACDAADQAATAWAALSFTDRWNVLVRFREAIRARENVLADAVVAETGKIRSEAKTEVATLLARFDLVRAACERDLAEGSLSGDPHERLRYHPLGVVAVIGPFNFPLHLCHAHVIPALLTGNTVVVKPTEVSPLAGQCYAEAAHAAGFPPGVFNLVQGKAETGRALIAHPAVRGLCFTGSYGVGRQIAEQALDRPDLLVALEMGGKNTVIVLDDASVRQAAHEIAVGGYLTTGQRCTATSRVLVQRSIHDKLIAALKPMAASLRFGDPDDPKSFAGPLATQGSRDRFERALAKARESGVEPILAGGHVAEGVSGYYVGASLHLVPESAGHQVQGYTDAELFGPDIAVEIVEDDDEAISVLKASPYGFACSVFTASDQRFERFFRLAPSGILNRNRSTNMASPRLPFGGLGKSGNYRPAGAWAQRNVVFPVAMLENELDVVTPHPMLAAHMPPPDLAQLAARHAAEEAKDSGMTLVDRPRPMGLVLPKGGKLPASEAWLTRLYAGERVVKEKKPQVFDHLRSFGPWMVSIDDEPLSVLDAMSQTATLCGGFSEDPVVRAYIEGGFGETVLDNADTSLGGNKAAETFANTLRRLVPGLPHVTFVNSGAEANEKALALCRLYAKNPDATRVLAFEGSFHGRTLHALHATHSPSKREPFQIAGHEAIFAPFPVWDTPNSGQPQPPAGFYAACAAGDIASLTQQYGRAGDAGDALLASEVRSLAAVHESLSRGDVFVCTVEPMQSEGGDRYATNRFFRALRLLTRYHGVALVLDEVQTGFGLGGPFAWFSMFGLLNARGEPDLPDVAIFAKRAQVGAVMSVYPDPEPTSAHPASLVRGRLHAEMVATPHHAERVEKEVWPRLTALAQAFPHLVLQPRACGFALAFDLPTADHLNAFLNQRFWRGAVAFGAGTKTARYRLSDTFELPEIELLFDVIRRSLAWIDAHPDAMPPAWEDRAPKKAAAPAKSRPEIRLRELAPSEGLALLPGILDMEIQIYEPARRTPAEEIRAALADPEGVTVVAEAKDGDAWHMIGFALGAPLEHSGSIEGPDRDPMLGRHNTLYSVSITVASGYQDMGVGRSLKQAQLRTARERKDSQGRPRYRYVTGRNRVGHTQSMMHLNRAFGAHVVCVLTGQYDDPEGRAIYYRIPLGPMQPDPDLAQSRGGAAAASAASARYDLASGLSRPLAKPPETLLAAERGGLVYGPAVNKITLMNYATTGLVRALEWIGAMLPELPHLYLTSSRDECLDKSLRILRWHRKRASVVIGLEGGYVGHTSGAARSVTDPAVHAQGPAVYTKWPRVPHPADAGVEATVAAIQKAVEAAGGSEQVFGLVCEIVQERTGRVIPAAFWPALARLRTELDLPVVVVETATAGWRSGTGPLATPATGFVPDLVWWWTGAQSGYIHCSARFAVKSPLTMVSTWDGDEMSLVRHHHQLRAIAGMDLGDAVRALDEAAAAFAEKDLQAQGLGCYRVVAAGGRSEAVAAHLLERGIRVRSLPGGRIAIVPSLDEAAAAAHALRDAVRALR